MYSVFDQDMIEMEIVTSIAKTKRGFAPTVPLAEIVNTIYISSKRGCNGTSWS
ncbi:hypothetical protein [Arenibacter sp. ARW7G5Y1]|uniref:hypothetical protein n=1 Tax=Arenibacter sp. ARW7G5Y1 TaxID=2135619 RepID=UPI000D99B9B5|nr:hypothetical protein [Arenibacter sp. ARW7G5Y1]PXX21458.1 hypothetical protein C7972_1346 [Arenibacter sp. ARW7G5Y1]